MIACSCDDSNRLKRPSGEPTFGDDFWIRSLFQATSKSQHLALHHSSNTMKSFSCALVVFVATIVGVSAVRQSNNDLEFGYFHLVERRRTKEAKAPMGMKAGKNKTNKKKAPKKGRT